MSSSSNKCVEARFLINNPRVVLLIGLIRRTRARSRSRCRTRGRRRARLRCLSLRRGLILPALLPAGLRLLLSRRSAGRGQQAEVTRLQDERGSDGRGGPCAVASALDDDGDSNLRAVERRDAEEPTVDAKLRVELRNRVFADGVAAAVALNLLLGQHLAGLRVVERYLLLGRAGLAAGDDALRLDGREHRVV